MSKIFDVAVFGATSPAGEALLGVLADSDLMVGRLYPLTTIVEKEAVVTFNGIELEEFCVETFHFSDVDVLFIPVGSQMPAETLHAARQADCLIVNGSHSAEDPVLLSSDEEALAEVVNTIGAQREVVVSSSVAALLLPILSPLQASIGIDSVNVVAHMSVASAGKGGFEELRSQTINLLSGKPVNSQLFSKRIAFNMIPWVGDVDKHGQSTEERAIVGELIQGLDQDDLRVSVTCVRVPVFFGDSLAVHLDMEKPVATEVVRDVLARSEGVELYQKDDMPTVEEAVGQDRVLVGRVRGSERHADQISFWVVSDTIKNCAIQSVFFADRLLTMYTKS